MIPYGIHPYASFFLSCNSRYQLGQLIYQPVENSGLDDDHDGNDGGGKHQHADDDSQNGAHLALALAKTRVFQAYDRANEADYGHEKRHYQTACGVLVAHALFDVLLFKLRPAIWADARVCQNLFVTQTSIHIYLAL